MELRVLNNSDLQDIDQQTVKDALRSAFAGLKNGASVQPAQSITVLPNGAGDAIFYPGALADAGVIGVKVSPYLSGLARNGKPPVTAYTLLLSTETGEPILLCDSLALTTVRTAATTSLALDYLVPDTASKIAVVGGGKVALEHLKYALKQHSWTTATIFSPALADKHHESHKARLSQLKETGFEVTVASSIRDAVKDAEVVLLCTSSGTPVVEMDWISSAQVVTSISTNVPRAHEIDPNLLGHFNVYCDYKETAPKTAGEMLLAQENGSWAPSEIVADLPDLVTGQSKKPVAGRPAYFRSTGLGIEDLAIASML